MLGFVCSVGNIPLAAVLWPGGISFAGVMAVIALDGLFSAARLIPATRPSRNDIFASVELDYKLVLNLIGLLVFAALFDWAGRAGPATPAPPHTSKASSQGV